MATTFLNELFKNYFLCIAYCHTQDVEQKLESAGNTILIDVFAHLPGLHSWILCWSTTGSNTVNRVFIPDTNAEFAVGLGASTMKVVHTLLDSKSPKVTTDTDVALLYRRQGMDTIAYCPLRSQRDGAFGIIRMIGRASDIAALGYPKGMPVRQITIPGTSNLPDPDLLPHVLGRWAGSVFGLRDTMKPLAVLLNAFSSFFPTAHAMYWKRDFENDEIIFHFSPSPNTARILQGLRAPMHSHDYMFAIVAERGASEIVDSFPEDLETDLRINASQWKETKYYNQLCQTLKTDIVSYIGIPLKVDDSVIGVVSVLTPRSMEHFQKAARFARASLSEMGRTIDKSAVSRASRIIRQFASEKASNGRRKSDLIPLGRELVTKLASELIPFGAVSVGTIEARFGTEAAETSGLPLNVTKLIQKQFIELVVSERINLFVVEPPPNRHPHRGVLTVPAPAELPFVLYVTGPLSLLGGRSLRSALEQLQAVLLMSIAATGDQSWLDNLALWSQIHDIKNDTAAFGAPLADLLNVAQHGTRADLVEEVLTFKERFARTIADFEAACDQTLKHPEFRKRESVIIYDIVRRAWAAAIHTNPSSLRRCIGRYKGDRTLSAVTYPPLLECVLRNMLTNVVKHFERQAKFGTITFSCEKSEKGKEVLISITDDVSESGAYKKVNDILDDPESKETLRTRIKPLVERQLQGRVWAEPNPNVDSVKLVLGIPTMALAH